MLLDVYLTPKAALTLLYLIAFVLAISAAAYSVYKIWAASTLLYWIPFDETAPGNGRVVRVLAECNGKYIVFMARVIHTVTFKGRGLVFEQVNEEIPYYDTLHSWAVEL